jgi:SecD/SecF fusion protein
VTDRDLSAAPNLAGLQDITLMKLAAFLPAFSGVSLLAAGTQSSWLEPFEFAISFGKLSPWITAPTVILLAIVIPFLLGWVWAKALKLPNYSWRIGLILSTVFASIVAIALGWPPKLGVDLKGGWIMIYQIDEANKLPPQTIAVGPRQMGEDTSNRAALIQKLKQRLNPDGLKEISIRPYGFNEIEIIVPETDRAEVEKLKRQIQEQGVMEFLILAERGSDSVLMETASKQNLDPTLKHKRSVMDGDRELGRWVRVGRDDANAKDAQVSVRHNGETVVVQTLRISGNWAQYLIRNAATGELVKGEDMPNGDFSSAKWLVEHNIPDLQILTKVHEKYRVTGDDLREGGLGSDIDENGRHEVVFAFKPGSASAMGGLTGSNIGRQLAIVLDDKVLSHATIQSQINDRGRITGNFTLEEVNFIIRILKAGSLPAKLKPTPVYEDPSDPTLGAENIRQGAIAVVVSLALVFVFCLAYYRSAGLVACIALAMNILLTVAVMILFGATLTMPGLAGLVLTVGMAVDSNVLIFERMREELDKGASLRMAIRNGYDRAMVTIIDSNLTTLLTAVILYVIGTDQLVGFAVTLTLGLIISMFTAVFCTRVIFEVAERTGWLRQLNFMHFFTQTRYDFVQFMGPCAVASIVLIAIGLAAAFYRGGGIFDIDLRGGSSVQVPLNKPMPDDQFRAIVQQAFQGVIFQGSRVDPTVKPVGIASTAGMHENFRVDTIIADEDIKEVVDGKEVTITKKAVDEVQKRLYDALKDESGNSLIKRHAVTYLPSPAQGARRTTRAKTFFTAWQGAEEEKPAADDPASDKPADDKTEDKKPEDAAKVPGDDGPSDTGDADKGDTAKTETPDKPASPPVVTGKLRLSDTAHEAEAVAQKDTIDQQELTNRVEQAAKELGLDVKSLQINVDHPQWDRDPGSRLSEWNVSLATTPQNANLVLEKVKEQLNQEPVWPASKVIGGQIAGNFVRIAIGALIASIVGIILYIWFRFQNVTWGFAAVVALIHDVLFMLAGIAVSYWIPGGDTVFYWTGLTEFKIDLTVIAAFLTLIGYSINDTIVIFDRMREIKGKLPNINRQIVNDSVNQTLSRSILTFVTVFVTVVVLYLWGGPGIHGFAYAMLIGTVVGMYSTVFIAAPFLLWMLNRNVAVKKA